VLLGLWVLPAPWGQRAWPLTLLAATAALLSAWAAIPQQVLTAHVELQRLAVLRLGIAAISVALACTGTLLFGLTGQFLALALSAAVVLPLSRRAARRTFDVPLAPRPEIDRSFVIRGMRLGISALVAGYAMQAAVRAIFWTLRRHLGDEANGQFSAAWAIGATYFSLLLDGVGSYVSPRYAAAQTTEELTREMEDAARFVFKTTPPTLLAAIVLRAAVIHGFYDSRFNGAIDILGLQMVADMCRTVSWVQAGPLLYRNRIGAFLFIEIAYALGLGLGVVLLVPAFGLEGVGYAYLGTNILYLFLSAVVVTKSCGVPFNGRRVALALLFSAAAFAVLRLDQTFPLTRWAVLAVAVVWWYRTNMLQGFLRRVQRKLSALRGRASPPPSPPPPGGGDADVQSMKRP
jgi:O-antigen/teichoic acid export membrane protein